MLLADWSFSEPAKNLACDEVMLNLSNANNGPEILRFWESPSYFVVLGYGKKRNQEADITACRELQIPVLRRCSGGGTVLQGEGCFNYSLIAQIPDAELPYDISATNQRIMDAQRDALQRVVSGNVEVRGYTDLTYNGLKFSGNAQRRKSRYLLFHGTILWDFDIALVEKVLLMPEEQPEYRGWRSHEAFIGNFPASLKNVRQTLMDQWRVAGELHDIPYDEIEELAAHKYRTTKWNEKF